MVLNSELVSGDLVDRLADDIVALRYAAWQAQVSQENLGRFDFDLFDRSGWHRLVRDSTDGSLIAASRLYVSQSERLIPDRISFSPILGFIEYPAAFLNRSVVHREYRRRGIWKKMIQLNLDYARSRGVRSTWIESSEERLATLESMGFKLLCLSADTQIKGSWFLLEHAMNSVSD